MPEERVEEAQTDDLALRDDGDPADDAPGRDGSSTAWIDAMRLLRVNWRAWLADWAVVLALGLVILAAIFLMGTVEF